MDTQEVNEVEGIEATDEQAFDLQNALYTTEASDLIDLPSGHTATIREMTGNEQRNFMNRSAHLSGTAVQQLLSSCVETFDEKPLPTDPTARTKFMLDLLSGDRATLVFQIRRYSLGDDFTFHAKCPACGKEEGWEVDLKEKGSFPMKKYASGDFRQPSYKSLIKPGLEIRWTQMDGNAEQLIIRKRKNVNALTDLEVRKPEALDPKSGKWIPIAMSKLADSLITEMRNMIRDNEGSTDTLVTLNCSACDQSVKFDLLLQPDFMTPSMSY